MWLLSSSRFWRSGMTVWTSMVMFMFGTQLDFTLWSSKPHFSFTLISSRQQNDPISLRLPAQLLLSGQWKWLGPPVQQQQLPAGPRLLIRRGRHPSVPLLPVSPGAAEPHFPGEPELIQPSTTGPSSLFLSTSASKHHNVFILLENEESHMFRCRRWLLIGCCCQGETVTLFHGGRLKRLSAPSPTRPLGGPPLRHCPDTPVCFWSVLFSCSLICSQKPFWGFIHPRFAQWQSHKQIKMWLK